MKLPNRYYLRGLEHLTNSLSFHIDHATYAIFRTDEFYHDQFPVNRIFLIERVPKNGNACLEWRANRDPWQTLKFRENRIVWMAPNLDLRFHFPRGLRLFAIHYQLSMIPGLDLLHAAHCCDDAPLRDRAMLQRLIRIAVAKSDSVEDLIWCRGALLSLTTIFLQKHTSALSGHLHIYQKYHDIFDAIEERPTVATSVATLAEKRGVTAEHLSRAFHADTGFTLKNLLTRRVLKEALQLLTNGTLPIQQITAQCGFSDSAYFTRFIQKHTRMTPRAYRAKGSGKL